MNHTKEERKLILEVNAAIQNNPRLSSDIISIASMAAVKAYEAEAKSMREQCGGMEIVASVGAQMITGDMDMTAKDKTYFVDLLKSKLEKYLPNKTFTSWEWFTDKGDY